MQYEACKHLKLDFQQLKLWDWLYECVLLNQGTMPQEYSIVILICLLALVRWVKSTRYSVRNRPSSVQNNAWQYSLSSTHNGAGRESVGDHSWVTPVEIFVSQTGFVDPANPEVSHSASLDPKEEVHSLLLPLKANSSIARWTYT